eukprot:4208603-Prorocentrum_lima.AAC.1
MTSSLVGSEMCIRDRPCTQIRVALEAQTSRCASPPCLAFSLEDVQVVASVSYTHLTLPTICSV